MERKQIDFFCGIAIIIFGLYLLYFAGKQTGESEFMMFGFLGLIFLGVGIYFSKKVYDKLKE